MQKNWCFWIVVLEKTLEILLDCKEIQPVHPKGDQSWVFIESTDAEAETPTLLPPHAKSWLIGKDPDAGRDWRQEKGMTEDEVVGWHHQLNGHEFDQAPGVGDGQGSLASYSPWSHRVRHNWVSNHEIKRRLLLGRKVMTNLDSILKSRDITLPTNVCLVKAMVFPVVMYVCKSWTIKKAECWRIDVFELWCRRRPLRVPWNCKEIQPVHPEGDQSWMFVGRTDAETETPILWPCKELTHWKRPWCWEWLGAGREEDDRGWDGWMASPTRWTWVWVNTGNWWWTGRPGTLRFMSQRVWTDWATELNWTECFTTGGHRVMWNSTEGAHNPHWKVGDGRMGQRCSLQKCLIAETASAAKSFQSCLILWDPIDSSPLGSPVPGILQARILEWVAISFSNAWKWKVKGNLLSHVQLFGTP